MAGAAGCNLGRRGLARELEDVACASAQELASAIPGFEAAMAWPGKRVNLAFSTA